MGTSLRVNLTLECYSLRIISNWYKVSFHASLNLGGYKYSYFSGIYHYSGLIKYVLGNEDSIYWALLYSKSSVRTLDIPLCQYNGVLLALFYSS